MNKSKFLALLATALVLAVATPFLTDAGFGHLLSVFFLQIFLTLPLAIIALIFYAINRKKPDHPHRAAKLLGTTALALFIQVVSLPIMVAIEHNRVRVGKNYCESLIPLIEQHRRENNAYPQELKQLPALPPEPAFLARQHFYRASSDGYAFDFHTPASFMSSYLYDSELKKWIRTD